MAGFSFERVAQSDLEWIFSKVGFWIPIFSRIPDSLCWIPDSKAQDSGFHKQKIPGFRNPDSLTWGETGG